jgi:hypothetical protein
MEVIQEVEPYSGQAFSQPYCDHRISDRVGAQPTCISVHCPAESRKKLVSKIDLQEQCNKQGNIPIDFNSMKKILCIA